MNVHLLFLDHGLSKSIIAKAICKKFHLSFLDLSEAFMDEVKFEKTDLGKELKTYLDNAELIPQHAIENFLRIKIDEAKNYEILLSGFSKTPEQFSFLQKILQKSNRTIEVIWYVKQSDPEKFLEAHFNDTSRKAWLDKYGEEVIEKWKTEHKKTRECVFEIQKMTKKSDWKIVEMEYVSELKEEFITHKINNATPI